MIISFQKERYENIEKLLKIVKEKNINLIVVNQGDKISVEKDLEIDILWPDKNSLIKENSINNNSIVFKLIYKKYSILFTGDIEKIAEEKILNKYQKNELKTDVLKVAHHGSKSSSIEKFVKAVNPKIAIIGVGENNKFGHPNEDVINRLKSFGVAIFRKNKQKKKKINN